MKKIINLFLKPFNLEIQPTKTKWERNVFAELYVAQLLGKCPKNEYLVHCIIFSKDRALQLHALLSTFYEKVFPPAPPVHVLYQVSNAAHAKAYEELIEIFNLFDITFFKQRSSDSFHNDLIEILTSIRSEKVLFLVDDIIFIEDLNINDFAQFDTAKFVPTLRMGINIKRCYTLQQNQPLPEWKTGIIKDENKKCWKWESGTLDWGYPLSVDGHLFSTQEITAIAQLISFNAPNTFEDGLQNFLRLFLPRFGVCYTKSKIVNIPCNRVQNERSNLYGKIDQEFLLREWQKNMQMNFRKLYGFESESAHQEIDFELIGR